MIYISEALLYISFAILTGVLLLRLVPETARPSVVVPHWLLLVAAVLIPLTSYMPIHQLIMTVRADLDMSYAAMAKEIILTFQIGKAWLWSTIGSAGLIVILQIKALRHDKNMPYVALFIVLLLAIWVGYASHSASLYPLIGMFAHSLHFIAVSVWIGVLFVISWFTSDQKNWYAFLHWFSPVAAISFVSAIAGGVVLMTIVSPEYFNSWMLSYGQLMLIKHVLLLPLVLFAFSNSFLYRRVIKTNPEFKPRNWLRAESIIALLVLVATAIMGEQAPPHQVKDTLQFSSPSPLFTSIYQGSFSPDLQIALQVTTEGALLFVAALVMIYGVFWCYKNKYAWASFAMGLCSSVFVYFGVMFSII